MVCVCVCVCVCLPCILKCLLHVHCIWLGVYLDFASQCLYVQHLCMFGHVSIVCFYRIHKLHNHYYGKNKFILFTKHTF